MAVFYGILKGTLWVVVGLWDLLTFSFFYLCQQPWKKIKTYTQPKAEVISHEGGITYRSITPISPMHAELECKRIDTMDKVFQCAIRRHGTKRCLGTRQVIAEEDEVQPDGKVEKKRIYVFGEYVWKTYKEVDELALSFGKGVRELGVLPKQRIAILAETREEWLVAAMGAFRQNITVVTLYSTLGEDAIIHGLKETQVEIVLTSHDQLPKFKKVICHCPLIKTIIFMENNLTVTDLSGYRKDVQILPFTHILSRGDRSGKGICEPTSDDIAIIMYTSGSTGTPKGVLLSHRNVSAVMKGLADILGEVSEDDIYVGYLPLAHVMELMTEAVCFLLGVAIGYSSPWTLTDSAVKIRRGDKGDLAVLRPTIMGSVPLVLNRIYKGIQDRLNGSGSLAKTVFQFFYDYKLRWYYRGYDTPLTDRLIFWKIREATGGRLRILAGGGAPLAPAVQEFLRTCLCVHLIQGYGMTETAACATLSLCSDMSIGRVGPPLGRCSIRLVDWKEGNYTVKDKPYPRGEILVGGDSVGKGYFNSTEESTKDFFEEKGQRWFRSGDIGEMQEDGVLRIIDRKKDLVKLQMGEYVSLGKVETELKTCSIVDNICVYGDPSKTFCVALIVPNPKQVLAIGANIGKTGLPMETLCVDAAVVEEALRELQWHGEKCKLQKFEIPRAVTLCPEVWTPDMGLVTAAFKLRRHNIFERYKGDIKRMYLV